MLERILSRLSPQRKATLKGWYRTGKVAWVRRFRAYGPEELLRTLRSMGVASGDSLLVHSAFGSTLGFRGSPSALIDALKEAVGPSGNVLMMSMSYMSSTADYLRGNPVFDVRTTASKMGLVSETFRRQPGVLRSLHPTHSVVASGPKAEWIVAGHEACAYPCGAGSPFEKLLALDGKVLFFGVTEFHFTFHHYLEDMLRDRLPFPLYEADPYLAQIVDRDGRTRHVPVHAFTAEAIRRRRVKVLFDAMSSRGQLRRARIGNTPMVLLRTSDSVACTLELERQGILFYDLDGRQASAGVAQ
jgi:aminoglycoside 3-N-acetyltransferase